MKHGTAYFLAVIAAVVGITGPPVAASAAPSGDTRSVAYVCVRKLASDPGNGGELERLKAAIPSIADQEERARFCLIYYLGALLYVHSIEAETVERYVQTRLAGSVAAKALQQDCLVPCVKCQSGTYLLPCRDCGGSGVCGSCKGVGASVARGFDGKPMRCAACSGTRQCRACAGVGGTRKKCETCGGRGGIRDEARAKTWYTLLLQTNVVVRMPAAATVMPATVRSGSRSRPFGFSVSTRDPPGKNLFCQTVAPDLEARRTIMLALAAGKDPADVLRDTPDVMLPFVVPWDDVVPVFDARTTMLQREQNIANRAAQLWSSALRIPSGHGMGYVFVRLRDGIEFRVREVKSLLPPDDNYVAATVEAPDGISYLIYAPRDSRSQVVGAHRSEVFRSATWYLVFEIVEGEINFWGNEIAVNKEDLIRRVLRPPCRQFIN